MLWAGGWHGQHPQLLAMATGAQQQHRLCPQSSSHHTNKQDPLLPHVAVTA